MKLNFLFPCIPLSFCTNNFEFEKLKKTLVENQLTAPDFSASDSLNICKHNFEFLLIFFDSIEVVKNITDYLSEIQNTDFDILAVWIGKDKLSSEVKWSLMKNGCSNVIIKDCSFKLVSSIKYKYERKRKIKEALDCDFVKKNLVGHSKVWKNFLSEIAELSLFTNSASLFIGESGSGKEQLSRFIHYLDAKDEKGDIVLADCGTIVPELSGSEFFGHEKGAFTNAVSSREGAFSLAHNGTLFLDEIGELPLRLQGELLRVIEDGIYKKIGSNIWKSTNFRLISATNKNLTDEIHKGNFRLDLYYRISATVFKVPTLNERKDDIRKLSIHFFQQFIKSSINESDIDCTVFEFLEEISYEGNVRELRQLVQRIASRHTGTNVISIGDIPESDRRKYESKEKTQSKEIRKDSRDIILKVLERGLGLDGVKNISKGIAIQTALENSNNNTSKAARLLKVTERSIQQWKKENPDFNSSI